MRDRRARLAFVGLILALPWFLCLRSPRRPSDPTSLRSSAQAIGFEPSPLVWGVELLVVGGLIHAVRERKRLLHLRDAERWGLGLSPAPFSKRADSTIFSPGSASVPEAVSVAAPSATVLSVRSQTVPAA